MYVYDKKQIIYSKTKVLSKNRINYHELIIDLDLKYIKEDYQDWLFGPVRFLNLI